MIFYFFIFLALGFHVRLGDARLSTGNELGEIRFFFFVGSAPLSLSLSLSVSLSRSVPMTTMARTGEERDRNTPRQSPSPLFNGII